MGPLKAHVHNGRIVIDEPTDLPEGEVVYLQLVDGDAIDASGDKERAALQRELEASIGEADAGDTEDLAAVIADLRSR